MGARREEWKRNKIERKEEQKERRKKRKNEVKRKSKSFIAMTAESWISKLRTAFNPYLPSLCITVFYYYLDIWNKLA